MNATMARVQQGKDGPTFIDHSFKDFIQSHKIPITDQNQLEEFYQNGMNLINKANSANLSILKREYNFEHKKLKSILAEKLVPTNAAHVMKLKVNILGKLLRIINSLIEPTKDPDVIVNNKLDLEKYYLLQCEKLKCCGLSLIYQYREDFKLEDAELLGKIKHGNISDGMRAFLKKKRAKIIKLLTVSREIMYELEELKLEAIRNYQEFIENAANLLPAPTFKQILYNVDPTKKQI